MTSLSAAAAHLARRHRAYEQLVVVAVAASHVFGVQQHILVLGVGERRRAALRAGRHLSISSSRPGAREAGRGGEAGDVNCSRFEPIVSSCRLAGLPLSARGSAPTTPPLEWMCWGGKVSASLGDCQEGARVLDGWFANEPVRRSRLLSWSRTASKSLSVQSLATSKIVFFWNFLGIDKCKNKQIKKIRGNPNQQYTHISQTHTHARTRTDTSFFLT